MGPPGGSWRFMGVIRVMEESWRGHGGVMEGHGGRGSLWLVKGNGGSWEAMGFMKASWEASFANTAVLPTIRKNYRDPKNS